MKCIKCGEKIKEVAKDETANHKTGQKYTSMTYHCEKDDIWLNLETPKTP